MTRIEIGINKAYHETLREIKTDNKLTWRQKRAARRAILAYHINLQWTLYTPPKTLINMTDNEEILSQ